jgi:endoglucanase
MNCLRYVFTFILFVWLNNTIASIDFNYETWNGEPTITNISPVSSNTIEITIRAGKTIPGDIYKITDSIKTSYDGDFLKVVDDYGNYIGKVIGPKKDHWWAYEKFKGSFPDAEILDQPDTYQIRDNEVVYVSRKSKPVNSSRTGGWKFEWPMEYKVYLELKKPIDFSKTYSFSFAHSLFEPLQIDLNIQICPAIHLNQLGFRPDDNCKIAYLSCWMGDEGGISYDDYDTFLVIDETNNKEVYKGKISLAKSKDETNEDNLNKNYSKTDVYLLDFSDFRESGKYHIYIVGLGKSHSFDISNHVYCDALLKGLRSQYHHRSGIKLGEPYTNYNRPRCFHPDDGVKVYQSTTSLKVMGNANFDRLVEGKTEKIVENAWGGIMDAGDWDRRTGHLSNVHVMCDLLAQYPTCFDTLNLNIPETGNHIPDVLDEAMFNLNVYKRMQQADGGIKGGIESAEHPLEGEVSWLESLEVYAYAAGPMVSYQYAGAAAHLSFYLKNYDEILADEYLTSAKRAMRFAESFMRDSVIEGKFYPSDYQYDRAGAALYMYLAARDEKWHNLFKQLIWINESTNFLYPENKMEKYRQTVWPLWLYAQDLPVEQNRQLQLLIQRAIINQADKQTENMCQMGFKFVKDENIPIAWGRSGSYPQTNVLIWAYHLTGDQKYKKGTLLCSQFGLGANPLNLSYTTGVGFNHVKNVLHIDSRLTGQNAPDGITVYGNIDYNSYINSFWTWNFLKPLIYPQIENWPVNESYFDVYYLTPSNEYTINHPPKLSTYSWAFMHCNN